MKTKKFGVSVILAFVLAGCASAPTVDSPTPLQRTLNALPGIFIDGRYLQFEFGGNNWVARSGGENYIAGTFTSADTIGGTILTLRQTHSWRVAGTGERIGMGVDRIVGGALLMALGESPAELARLDAAGREAADTESWRRTSGPEIVLEHRVGPPATLSRK